MRTHTQNRDMFERWPAKREGTDDESGRKPRKRPHLDVHVRHDSFDSSSQATLPLPRPRPPPTVSAIGTPIRQGPDGFFHGHVRKRGFPDSYEKPRWLSHLNYCISFFFFSLALCLFLC